MEMDTRREAALDSTTAWAIAFLGLLILTLVWGFIFTFTVYADTLATTYGLSSFQTSSVFSIMTAAFFVVGGGLGLLIARLPLRPVVATVAVGLALAFGALQVVSTYLGVIVAFVLIGTTGGTIFVIITALVPQWFDVYQGRAMGVAMTGNGLGVLVLPPVWLWLLERTDLRLAFAIVGGVTVATCLLASLLYRRPPGVRTATTVDLAWIRNALANRTFLVAISGFALMWSWYFALSADLVGILTSTGFERSIAATAFGIVGGISVFTRIISGSLADRFGLRAILTVGVGFAAVALLGLIWVDTLARMYITLAVFGFGLGAVATLFSPIILGSFGSENAVAIIGLFTMFEATTAFLVPVGVGALVQLTGGYDLPLAVLAAVSLLGVGMFYWATKDPDASP